MRKLLLLTGAAALAAAMPAAAEKGGKGGNQGGGHAAKVHQGGGGGAKAQRGGGGQAAKAQRGGGQAAKVNRGGGGQMARGGKPQKAERQARRVETRSVRGGGRPDRAERRAVRNDVKRQERVVRQSVDDRFDDRRLRDVGAFADDGRRFGGASCPPGLAKKSPACVPPGQAMKLGLGDRIGSDWFGRSRIPSWYSGFYPDTADYYYRYDDNGYIYRIDRNGDLVSSIIPLLGGGFAVGQPLPTGYDVYNVPIQYRDVYYDNDDYLYRYGDNAIYRVNAGSGIIESVVALLTGDVNVGQRLPTGYDVYNVPMAYRDRYYDNDDYMYRYADGNIYQVDAQTQLVQAIVEMLL